MDRRLRYTLISAVASASVFSILLILTGFDLALRLSPIFAFIPAIVYMQLKEKKFSCSSEVVMNEAPAAIGMMSVALTSNVSFDSAIRDIAKNGPKNIAGFFRKVVTEVDCRSIPDIKSGIKIVMSELPKDLSSFRRAMFIVMTAFESADQKERAGMMKDAESIVLAGLKEMGESYSSKLNSPCMLIFGLGIMVPMILVSVLPMLSISGQFGSAVIDSDMVSFITLVCIPAVVGLVILSLKGKNPFFKVSAGASDLKYLVPLLAMFPVYYVLTGRGFSGEDAIVISAVASAAISLAFMAPRLMDDRKRYKTEEMLKDAMFELGNRLITGENYETAMKGAFSSRHDCKWVSESVTREMEICRGDIEGAIKNTLSPYSPMMAGFYIDVYRASVRDTRDAGRLASSIAHQLQDQNSIRKNIENRLKSMLDMMTGTSAVFAPLILGMSVVMLGPLSKISGSVCVGDMSFVLIFYLIELAALISVLSSNLMCKGGIVDMQCRFCSMMPIALVIFSVCSKIVL